jgi:hypothetical protein
MQIPALAGDGLSGGWNDSCPCGDGTQCARSRFKPRSERLMEKHETELRPMTAVSGGGDSKPCDHKGL